MSERPAGRPCTSHRLGEVLDKRSSHKPAGKRARPVQIGMSSARCFGRAAPFSSANALLRPAAKKRMGEKHQSCL